MSSIVAGLSAEFARSNYFERSKYTERISGCQGGIERRLESVTERTFEWGSGYTKGEETQKTQEQPLHDEVAVPWRFERGIFPLYTT